MVNEPPTKRLCIENFLWYKLDNQMARPLLHSSTPTFVFELVDLLNLNNVVVKMGCNTLMLKDKVPQTSEENPLLLITEVGKFCKLHQLLICADPSVCILLWCVVFLPPCMGANPPHP